VKKDDPPYSFRCYRLPKGAHGIEISAEDFEVRQDVLFVTPDHVQTIVRDLPREKGSLRVLSNVKDVSMKAYRRGTSSRKPLVFSVPWNNITLEAGEWVLQFEKSGYWKTMRIIRVKKDSRIIVHANMRKR
ncbi:MAG: hypothetical protein ACYTFG_21770, partial [Planctomycetota bacterium]|jgi:hypothetical protein